MNSLIGEARYRDRKFMSVFQRLELPLSHATATELVTLLLTPGFSASYHVAVFGWGYKAKSRVRAIIAELAPEVWAEGLPQANMRSITLEDGMAMLKALLWGRNMTWHGGVPLWSTLALQASPLSRKELAKDLGVGIGQIRKWSEARTHDPLTAARLLGEHGSGEGFGKSVLE